MTTESDSSFSLPTHKWHVQYVTEVLFISFIFPDTFLHKLKLNSPDKLSAVKTQTQQTSYLIKLKFCLHE